MPSHAETPDNAETPDQELIRLRRRVAELEAELAVRPVAPRPSGNLAQQASILIAVEVAMVLFCLPLAHWCNAGQLRSSGGAELAYVAGLLVALAIPISLCAVNVLLFALWSIATGPRLLIGGSLAVAMGSAVVWQWWVIEMDELVTFAAGALCMLFVPATGLRLLTRWRWLLAGESLKDQHAAPRTFDLLLLTVVFAIGISIIRWYFGSVKLELNSGYLWSLAAINSLLPATVVCLGAYCSVRVLLGSRRAVWFPAAVLVNGLAGGLFILQIATAGFQSWPPEFWPQMVHLAIDAPVLVMAIGIPLLFAPLVPIGACNLSSMALQARSGGEHRGAKRAVTETCRDSANAP